MDSFERAHVMKTEPSRKDNKSEEAVKRQLKKMLYGYKQSDNKLIKESAATINKNEDLSHDLDDSTSVSGFSDLNLTNSSTGGDSTQGILVTLTDDSIDEDELELSKASSEIDIEDNAEGITDSIASISEYDVQSLSEDIREASFGSVDTSETSFLSSRNSESSGTGTDSDGSELDEFDADGALASKILEKLGKKEKISGSKKGKKRKLVLSERSNECNKDNLTKKKPNTVKEKKYNEDENTKQLKRNRNHEEKIKHDIEENQSNSDYDFTENFDRNSIIDQNDSITPSSNFSSPFISITATDMPDQSLSEILGEYRHPTVKNLPSEKQNIIYSTNNLGGAFTVESLNMSDVQIEEEADSLVPELGDEQVIEDFEMEAEMDESTQVPNEETTTVYDETIQSELLSDPEASPESLEADYVNPIKIFYGKHSCIFILKHPTRLYIHGKVKVRALGGTTEVCGHTLQDQSYELFAPNCDYAHCLKTIARQNAYYGLFGKLTSSGVSVKDTEEIVTTIGEYDTILSLTSTSSRVMEFVENNFTAGDLFAKPSKNIENCLKKASGLLGCSLYLTKPWKCFDENSSWEQVVEYGLANQSKGIVCGGKGTGKSTFLRYYVNRLLANGPVLVIDLDPGQAEFTVPGSVSATVVTKPLLGPNFTHLTTPDKMLNIGMINTMDNTSLYASAVESLLAYCYGNTRYQSMPWIVNTMGMCNNMGLKYITYTILHTRPTFLLQIQSKIAKKRFEVELHPSSIKRLHQGYKYDKMFRNMTCSDDLDYAFVMADSAENVRSRSSLSPADERYLNFLAYFGELLNVHNGPGLLGIVPYEVKLQDLNMIMNVKVPENAVTKAINGKIVALCQLATQDKGKMFTLGDNAVQCLGHGLVRGVDFEKGVLYIVTPAPIKTLSRVDTLLYADWVPELRGQETHLPEGTCVPYRTTSVHQQRQLMISPRRRFNPLQLLKLSRNS